MSQSRRLVKKKRNYSLVPDILTPFYLQLEAVSGILRSARSVMLEIHLLLFGNNRWDTIVVFYSLSSLC